MEGQGPLGKTVEFDAKTVDMSPERGIGWQSTGDNGSKPPVRYASKRWPMVARV